MRNRYYYPLELAVFCASLVFFGLIIYLKIPTDIQWHSSIIWQVVNGDSHIPATFLYYVVEYTVALFRTDMTSLSVAAVLILSLSVTAKFYLTKRFAIQYYESTGEVDGKSLKMINSACVLLLLVFSLPTGTGYVGQIPPNIWHNDTTIFVMPFALALFILSHRQITLPTTKRLIGLTVLCVFNIAIKPSYFFVFVVAYPMMLCGRLGLKRSFWINMAPVIIGLGLTLLEYYLIYKLSFAGGYAEKTGIVINPLHVWSHFSVNIPLSLLASLVFPIIYFVFYWKDFARSSILWYAVISYVVAVLMMALLSETGAREYHGNFFWQAIICSYMLFFVMVMLFTERICKNGLRTWKEKVVLLAFMLHVIAGVRYLGIFIQRRAYW